jgi:hypothetical protein
MIHQLEQHGACEDLEVAIRAEIERRKMVDEDGR